VRMYRLLAPNRLVYWRGRNIADLRRIGPALFARGARVPWLHHVVAKVTRQYPNQPSLPSNGGDNDSWGNAAPWVRSDEHQAETKAKSRNSDAARYHRGQERHGAQAGRFVVEHQKRTSCAFKFNASACSGNIHK
jgi:hypothetical protein